MKKSNKIFFIIIIAIILICSIIGLKVRDSITDIEFKDISNNSKEYKYTIFNPRNDAKNLDIVSIKNELENTSDLIISGEFTGYRKILYGCVLSEVDIITKYKGTVNSEYIYIYEPIQINLFKDDSNVNGVVISNSGYGLIKENKEYMFFLKEESVPPGFNELKKSENGYTYVNNEFSKFSRQYNKSDYKILDSTSEETFYDEVIYYDQVFLSKEVFDSYNELNKLIINKYNY